MAVTNDSPSLSSCSLGGGNHSCRLCNGSWSRQLPNPPLGSLWDCSLLSICKHIQSGMVLTWCYTPRSHCVFVHMGILYAGTVDTLSDIVEAHCDKWRIDLDEHTHNRINQSIATDCRTFRRRRPSSIVYTLCTVDKGLHGRKSGSG